MVCKKLFIWVYHSFLIFFFFFLASLWLCWGGKLKRQIIFLWGYTYQKQDKNDTTNLTQPNLSQLTSFPTSTGRQVEQGRLRVHCTFHLCYSFIKFEVINVIILSLSFRGASVTDLPLALFLLMIKFTFHTYYLNKWMKNVY